MKVETSNCKGLRVRQIHLAAKHEGYFVDACYPLFTAEPKQVAGRLNKLIKHVVNTNVAAKPSKTQTPNHYSCKYKICHWDERLPSIDFEFRSEGNGVDYECHKTLNLELSPGVKEIEFRAIFRRQLRIRVYEALSDLCIEEFDRKLKRNFLLPQDTLIIRKDRLPSFDFTSQGMNFHFSPGFVASEEMGCQTAFLKYSLLKYLMQRKSPIFRLAAKHQVSARRNSKHVGG